MATSSSAGTAPSKTIACCIPTTTWKLGDNVLLTHGAVVHGGKVGNYVLVGVNAVLLEDADVGDYVFIGAGAIVRGHVPPHSLVIGVPGQIRPLSPAQEARLQDPTANYVRNAKRFIANGLGLQIPDPSQNDGGQP